MKVGRNEPCPCGSGKKYKKCCLGRDQDKTSWRPAPDPRPASEPEPPRPRPIPPIPSPPPQPRTPRQKQFDALWEEFESRQGEARVAVFLRTLDDDELSEEETLFEMLNQLHPDFVERGERGLFAALVENLRSRRPEVFEASFPYYLSWLLKDALVDNLQEAVASLARERAAAADRDYDSFHRDLYILEYHGQLSVLIEVHRIAWPKVKTNTDIFGWAIGSFASAAADHEIFDFLEHTSTPDPADPALLERLRFYGEDLREDYVREFIRDLTATSDRTWTTADFALKPPRKQNRDDWDEHDKPTPDQGAINLSRLIVEFVGYLRRVEGVPFPRGELVRNELYQYFIRRHNGSLDPQPSMMESFTNPKLKLPKPPSPAHPLCPERVTLDVHLAGLMGMMSGLYHTAAALFLAMPAWLRFLESRRLIDANTRKKVADELLPLHATLLKIWEAYSDDPALYREGKAWTADAAKGPLEAHG